MATVTYLNTDGEITRYGGRENPNVFQFFDRSAQTMVYAVGCCESFAFDVGSCRVATLGPCGFLHTAAFVHNECSADLDFRVEGLNNTNMAVMDAANDSWGFGAAIVDGAAHSFNNLTGRTAVTVVGNQLHMPAQTTEFDNGSGTIAVGAGAFFGIPTWKNTCATLTMTNTATVYIQGAPVDSCNVTATDGACAKALWVAAGNSQFCGKVDLNSSGTLLNVGAAGNDWTANALTLCSSNSAATNLLTVKNSETANAASDAQIDITSGGACGGDPAILFLVSGAGVFSVGIDNTDGDEFKWSANAALGTSDQMKMTATGTLSVNADGGGCDDPVLLFDTYCDRQEIQRFAHGAPSAIYYGTSIAQRDANRQRMVDIGVAEWGFGDTPDVRDRWFMRIQPMFRLMAGGIYQMGEKVDNMEALISGRLDCLGNRLATAEKALATP